MISMVLMAKHYDLIFDESLSTYILKLRKKAVDQLLPLISSWEKSGAESLMVTDMFEPFFEEIGSAQSEDDIQRIIDNIKKVKKESMSPRDAGSLHVTQEATPMDWDDPAARYALAERIGVEAYNKAFEDHIQQTTIATVCGHAIRPVNSKFGKLFQVGYTGRAFETPQQAKKFASENPMQGQAGFDRVPQKEDGCPFGGDIEDNCKGCAYSSDYHFKDGECIRRDDDGAKQ